MRPLDPPRWAEAGRLAGAAVVVFGAAYGLLALWIDEAVIGEPWGPRWFPLWIGGCLVVLGLVWMWRDRDPRPVRALWTGGRSLMALVAILLAYALGFERLGYLVSTPLALGAVLYLFDARSLGGARGRPLRRQRWLAMGLVAVTFTVAAYAVFHLGLGVYLPALP